jgi:putative DNA primase/helicase
MEPLTYQEALYYAAKLNLPIIPVCPPDHQGMSQKHQDTCTSPGKRPLIKAWQKAKSPTHQQINKWFSKNEHLNLGLVLGRASNIIAIDRDGEDGDKYLKEMSKGDLPKTWQFTTPGGGMRYLYAIPDGLRLQKYSKASSTEVHSECALLGEGQMTVLPPSVHVNGKRYEWCEGHHPSEIEIAQAPSWMIKLMSRNKASFSSSEEFSSQAEETLEILARRCPRFAEEWRTQQKKGLDEERWFRWSSLLVSTDQCEAAKTFSMASTKHNLRSEKRIEELKNMSRSAMVRCTTIGCNAEQISTCFGKKVRVNEHGEITNSPGTFIQPTKIKNAFKQPTNDYDYLKDIGFTFKKGAKVPNGVNGNKFARHILAHFDFLYTSGERFYLFEDGLWKFKDYNQVSRILRELLHRYVPDIWTLNLETKYLEALKREAKRVEHLDSNRHYINLKNGMLNLKTFKLEPHQKEFYSSIRVPIQFDETATCPTFMKFLEEVFEGDQERIKLTAQIFGYCLTAETRAQKAFIFFGKGSNGKSVLADVLVQLCGTENVSAVSLKELEHGFSRYELVDKLLNLSTENEVGSGGLNTQYFKAVVSGEPIRVERKHEQGFMYKPFCKLVFALNNLPYSKDKSFGFQRRLIIVPFNKTFEGKKADVHLPEKLKEELPGILNFALGGLKELRESQFQFVECKAVKQAIEDYAEKLNPIRKFVNETFQPASVNHRVFNRNIRKRFLDWCEENGHSSQYSQTTFLNTLKDILTEKKIPFDIGKSGGQRYISGIRLVEVEQEAEEDELEELDDINLL